MKALLKRLSGQIPDRGQGLPQPDTSVFVVGDVHGRADLLGRLLTQYPDTAGHLVFVGDLIDRGDDSAAVLTRVKGLCDTSEKIICLRGNHEQMLLDFLDNPQTAGPRWLNFGGLQTLASFGVGGLSVNSEGAALEEAAIRLREQMSPELIHWIAHLPLIWRSGNLAVVHAAADPESSLEEQHETTLLWGCSRFLQQPRRDAQWVVHGHSIVETPIFKTSRISIDTGAYYTGVLTGAFIEPDGKVEFIAT